MSRRTFYELFSDREDCFLAAFEHALELLAERVLPAYESEREWEDSVRAALAALLEYLDGEPALRRLVFVEALTAGPRVLARRTQILDELTSVIDRGRADGKAPAGVPALVAQGIAGATFGVIYGHLSERNPEPLIGLLGSLMATIVLPYRGSAAAAQELARHTPPGAREASRSRTHRAWRTDRRSTGSTIGQHASEGGRRPIVRDRPAQPIAPLDFRLTVRTQMALTMVAKSSARGANPSNLDIARRIGISTKGAASRIMSRLEEQGLVENTRGRDAKGVAKAWRLTPYGQAVLDAHIPVRGGRGSSPDELASIRGGKLVPKRGRRAAKPSPGRGAPSPVAVLTHRAGTEPRLTVRTHMVLSAVAEHAGASSREIADAAGVRDEGQLSKLLARLQDRGLICNTARAGRGKPNAWRLTPHGEALLDACAPAQETQAA